MSRQGWCEERGARGLASAQAGCNVGSHGGGRRRKRRPEPLAGVNARRFGTSGYSKSTRPTSEMGLCSDRTPVTDGSADSGHFQGPLICPKRTNRRHSKRDYPVAANVKTGRFPTTSVLACKKTYMQTLAIV